MIAKLARFPRRGKKPEVGANDNSLTPILRLLNQVASIADDTALEPKQAIEAVFSAVCDYTHWPIGHLYVQCSKDTSSFVSAEIWHLQTRSDHLAIAEFKRLSEQTQFSLGKGLIGKIAQQREALAVKDVTVMEQFLRAEAAKKNNVRGFFGFPVLLEGECVAVAEFFGRQVGLLDKTSLEIMNYVSSQIARIYERSRFEDRKRVLSKEFETSVQEAVGQLGETSTGLTRAAQRLSRQCEASLETSSKVSMGAEEIQNSSEPLKAAASTLTKVEKETEKKTAKTLRTVEKLASDINTALSQLETLNSAAEDIESVVGYVGEIAGKVRMLGLNASIEAMRAGEGGKGFAIVASEIKNLAAQSEAASKDISRRISSIQATVQSSTDTMTAVGLRMDELEMTAEDMANVIENQREASLAINQHVVTSQKTIKSIAEDVYDMNSAMTDLTDLSSSLNALAKGLEGTACEVSDSSKGFMLMMER